MKKSGIMNSRMASVVADVGHTDLIGVVDAGFPIPDGPEKIDLAVTAGLPSFMDVLKNILTELCIEEIILAEDMLTKNQALKAELDALLSGMPGVKATVITHSQLKADSARCKAVIRTGECVPFANVLLRAGVVF